MVYSSRRFVVCLSVCHFVLVFFNPFSIAIPRLGKRELILVLSVRLFGLCLFRFVGFLFLLESGKGCGLWLCHTLDFSLTFFVTGNYNFETGSMTNILEQLGWESLHKRRKGSKLILLFKGLKGRASIPCNDHQPPNRWGRNQHPMAFQVPYARTDIYKYSFFPDTVRDWNALPASIIYSAESSEVPVARFISLVRSRD